MASREQQAGLQPPAQAEQAPEAACQVCGQAAAKYCCPRCDRRTCSLDCVKAHKEATGCSGKRDRTAFVGRGAFDERTFLSDYRFLEEVKLADDVAKRSKPPAPKVELPQFLQTLQYQARRRGVQLHILSPGMEKRRTNSTRYDGRMQTLYWHVEWSFPAAGCKATDTKVHENTPIAQLLAGHLALQPGAAAKHHALREHREAGQERLTVLLRKERTPANAAEYYEIDAARPLRQQLAGKVLVEFPTFLVLLPHEREEYIIISAAAAAAAGAAATNGAAAAAAGPDAGAAAAGEGKAPEPTAAGQGAAPEAGAAQSAEGDAAAAVEAACEAAAGASAPAAAGDTEAVGTGPGLAAVLAAAAADAARLQAAAGGAAGT
ncbi:hypothetical protein COHA_001734 [Chlorella ohadii]|uniref:Box C/D snoRNA protein 1 n=1 Tax=Chlorella ohadii TaxID=2649997 RepID=A0AAD5DYG1_9CHLO|nr:hypothetical protein COHA_001734 [Chlorella ohadii]